jgi:Scaffold protein Nfu/NifU N terminal
VHAVQVSPEPTPNPNAIKFTLDRPSTDGGAETFKEGSDPAASALGARIFSLGDVTNVFATANFVSVTKADGADWNDLGPKVVGAIEAHFGEDGA